MPEATPCRSGRHLIKSSQDRRANGGCAQCARANQRRYGARCRDARRRLTAIEAALSL
jgi:hypothetical protein